MTDQPIHTDDEPASHQRRERPDGKCESDVHDRDEEQKPQSQEGTKITSNWKQRNVQNFSQEYSPVRDRAGSDGANRYTMN